MTFGSDYDNKRFQIVEDVPEVGAFLVVFDKKDEFLERYLRKDMYECMDFAFERFGIPRKSWVMVTK